jgi:nitroimidazol reductase NimA-like FMN-containing flavoprotein (pyridoxamine 5'-phosphate oxidase superfamily)
VAPFLLRISPIVVGRIPKAENYSQMRNKQAGGLLPKEFIESREEMEKLLVEERVGYLGLVYDNRPYVIPLTYGYSEGRLVFHCAVKGSKLDIIKTNPNVCLTVSRHFGEMVSHPQGAECHINSDSVICYGKARIIENIEERCQALNMFNRCLQPTAREITIEEVENCSAVEIIIDTMTGRSERDGKCTYWKHTVA